MPLLAKGWCPAPGACVSFCRYRYLRTPKRGTLLFYFEKSLYKKLNMEKQKREVFRLGGNFPRAPLPDLAHCGACASPRPGALRSMRADVRRWGAASHPARAQRAPLPGGPRPGDGFTDFGKIRRARSARRPFSRRNPPSCNSVKSEKSPDVGAPELIYFLCRGLYERTQ